MYKISLVFWSMGELGILLSIFTDLAMYEVFRILLGFYGLLNESFQLKTFQSTIS